MPTYRHMPTPVDAVQFTGDNWAEMHDFTGHRETPDGDTLWNKMDVFNPIGTFIPDHEYPDCWAELWVERDRSWKPIHQGDVIIKDRLGFYPCDPVIFRDTYILEEDFENTSYLDNTSSLPMVGSTDGDARMLGRVRLALILSRPMSEVDAICDRIAHVFGMYRVGLEQNGSHGGDTMDNVRRSILSGLRRGGPGYTALVESIVSEMQNDGFLFRERTVGDG